MLMSTVNSVHFHLILVCVLCDDIHSIFSTINFLLFNIFIFFGCDNDKAFPWQDLKGGENDNIWIIIWLASDLLTWWLSVWWVYDGFDGYHRNLEFVSCQLTKVKEYMLSQCIWSCLEMTSIKKKTMDQFPFLIYPMFWINCHTAQDSYFHYMIENSRWSTFINNLHCQNTISCVKSFHI